MLPVLVACSVFNDKDNIKRHLLSIPQYVHQLTIDGRYKDFDHPSDLSDDGTREVVNVFFNTLLIDAGGLTEIEKRQIYFDRFNPINYKFLLVADSDEYFVGDWQEFIYELDDLYEKYYTIDQPVCIGIKVHNPPTEEFDPRPRIWINAHNVKMGPKHNEFRNKLDNSGLYFSEEVKSMKLKHDYRLRYPSYNNLRLLYQSRLISQEDKIYSPF
jgi:hypothetical protein